MNRPLRNLVMESGIFGFSFKQRDAQPATVQVTAAPTRVRETTGLAMVLEVSGVVQQLEEC